jgi:hypothetical protein
MHLARRLQDGGVIPGPKAPELLDQTVAIQGHRDPQHGDAAN